VYGQGGGCAYDDPSWMYHNSFIIADSKKAYVLETADNWWVVEKVKNVRSISNSITIRGKGDRRKEGIISTIPSPYSRGGKSSLLLSENVGKITPKLMMEFLREHQAGICMHGGFESVGSQVSHLRNGKKSIHWFTGTTLPCVSIYKPYAFPIEGQKVYVPGPYQMVESDWFWLWFWLKHARSKPVNRKIDLRNIENSIISRVDDIINQEDTFNDENFIEKIKILNLEAWNKSYEMIN